MRIIVPIKQVPETGAVRMDEATGTVIREGVEASRVELPIDWGDLQRPGYSPDFYSPRSSDSWPYSLGTKMEDWVPNVRGAAFRRYSQPLLAYIAGGPEHFTGREGRFVSMEETLDGCQAILQGEFDDAAESALYMIGPVGDARSEPEGVKDT